MPFLLTLTVFALVVAVSLCMLLALALWQSRGMRKKAQHEARAAEHRLAAILTHGQEILVEIDSAGAVLGRYGTGLAGWNQGEIDGSNILDLVHPEDQAAVAASIDRSRITGQSVERLETRGLQSDGEYRWYETSTSNFIGESGQRHLLVVSRDVEDRKRSELAVQESERRYRSMVDQSPFGVMLVDKNMKVLFANSAYVNLVGATAVEDLLSQNLWGSPAFGSEGSLNAISRVAAGESVEMELSYTSRFGKRVDASMHVSPLLDEHRAVIGAQILCQDVSESRRLEDQLRRSQKMRAVGQLAGGIAHDFNNYLTVILGCADAVLEGSVKETEVHQAGLEIVGVAERCAVLTESLLAFSRRREARPQLIELDLIVAGLDPMIRRLMDESIDFQFVRQGDARKIWFDPGLMEQILLNLVMNAADAMSQGARLTIEVNQGSAFKRHDLLSDGVVELIVRDTGCGMSQETLQRACEPFFTTKSEGHGTGLGLSTVYGIIEQAGGALHIESELGYGTSFHIVLPEGDEVFEIVQASMPQEPAAERGCERILLVEDEATLRSLTRRILVRCGYSVIEAADGEEALEVYQKLDAPPDLVLSDIVMPRLSGADLIDSLRKEQPDLKVLFMSGYYSDRNMKVGSLPSDAEVLSKPFSVRQLRERVREILDDSDAA